MGGRGGARPLRRQHRPDRHDHRARVAPRRAGTGLARDAVVVGLAHEEHPRSSHLVSARAALRTARRDRYRLHHPLPVDDALVPRDARRRAHRPSLSRREPCAGESLRAVSRPNDGRRAGADARPEARRRRARVRGARAGIQDGSVRGPRPAIDRRRRRTPARHVRGRQRVRLRPAVGQVCRARGRAGVPQLAAVTPRHALRDELRVQPRRRARREPRVAVQVAVPLGGDAPLPDAAVRLPRRRRGVGVQPVLGSRRPLGEAQRRRHPEPRSAISSTSTRWSRSSTSTATTVCAAASTELHAYFARPSGRPEQLDEFAAAALDSVAGPPRPLRAQLLLRMRSRRPPRRRGRSPSASIPPARACGRSSVPTSRTGTCTT